MYSVTPLRHCSTGNNHSFMEVEVETGVEVTRKIYRCCMTAERALSGFTAYKRQRTVTDGNELVVLRDSRKRLVALHACRGISKFLLDFGQLGVSKV